MPLTRPMPSSVNMVCFHVLWWQGLKMEVLMSGWRAWSGSSAVHLTRGFLLCKLLGVPRDFRRCVCICKSMSSAVGVWSIQTVIHWYPLIPCILICPLLLYPTFTLTHRHTHLSPLTLLFCYFMTDSPSVKKTGDILYLHNDIIRNTFWARVWGKKQGSIQTGDLLLAPLPPGICHRHQMENWKKKLNWVVFILV